MRASIEIFTALLLSLGLVGLGCSGSPIGRIAEEYGYAEPQASLEPMVVVPGFLGSALVDRDSGHELWGLFLAGEQRSSDPDVQRRIALPMTGGESLVEMRDAVEVKGVMMAAEVDLAGMRFTVNAYPGMLAGILRGLSGEVETDDPTPSARQLRASVREAYQKPPAGLYPVAYDWRRDIAESAQALDAAVRAAHAEKVASGLTGDAARVDIFAHSMGTLVTRYYLRYGTQPLPQDGSLPVLDWRGAERVRRVVLVAPPNNGSLEAFRDLTRGGSPEPPIPPYPAALLSTFVSLYQMMPHASAGAVVRSDDGSPIDIYSVETWERLGWGPFGEDQDEVLANLLPEEKTPQARRDVARRFVSLCMAQALQLNAALDIPSRPPAGMTLHAFVGDSIDTPGIVEIDAATGEHGEIHEESGDGTVTRRSALGRMRNEPRPRGRLESPVHWTSVHFVEGDHLALTASRGFLDAALYLLLEAPLRAER